MSPFSLGDNTFILSLTRSAMTAMLMSIVFVDWTVVSSVKLLMLSFDDTRDRPAAGVYCGGVAAAAIQNDIITVKLPRQYAQVTVDVVNTRML
jgi:hypothetical protein